jgi:UPF0176 protein
MATFLTAALYKFVELPDFAELKAPLLACCEENEVKGTILLAEEGINGTIAGIPEKVQAVLAYLHSDLRLADLTHKESYAEKQPFYRMKVRLKREIVTMGVSGINPTQMAGKYVKPEAWNELLNDPNVIVVDARNDYEVSIGTFKGAINPKTKSFSELPEWLRQETALKDKPKVAMFCTGGIRCEKSTAFLRSEGFEEVYHLEGGILKYLETIPTEESLWEGECFVFDERVAVGHGLKPGSYELCRACRQPISSLDKSSDLFELGISCPNCYGQKNQAQQKRLAERQRQIELAHSRNQSHMGANYRSRPKSDEKTHNTRPILYSFRRCPFAMRARMALSISGQVCELREVVLRDKPQELLDASAKGTVPVLIDTEGRVLDESIEIMLWALKRHDPEQWLMPEQGSLEEMLSLIAQFDDRFKYHLDRYKYAERYEDTDALTHRTEGALYLEKLSAQLDNTTYTTYLFGAHAALADIAIAPFIRQFALADQTWFNAQPWPQLQAWLAALLDSELYTRVMQKYPKWISGSPGVVFPPAL